MGIFTKRAQQIFASVDENGFARAISEQEAGVWGSEVEADLKILEQHNQLINSPLIFNAKGDGTTDDAAKYALAEAANDNIFLPSATVFNLGSAVPSKPVYGPGKLKKGSVELGGYQLQVDAYRSTIFLNPTDYTDKVGAPTSGYNKGVLIGSGAILQNQMNRFVGIGSHVFRMANVLDRVIAIGDGNMEFSKFAERHTSVGTTASQWLGTDRATVELTHPFWIEAAAPPGNPLWDFQGMETRNPGVGARLNAFSAYAAQATDTGRSVAVGRNAIGGNVISRNDVAVGYRALGGWETSNNVAVGSEAFWEGLFQTQGVAIGQAAGQYWQDGTRNTIVGRAAASNVVRGSYNVILGSFAGVNLADSDDNLFLGYGAGNALTGTDLNDLFVISNRNRNWMLVGDFATGAMGIGLDPTTIRAAGGGLHLYGSGFGASEPASAAADDLIMETSANTGQTIRSGATSLGTIAFARPGQSTRGIIQYDHSTDRFNISVAGNRMIHIGGAQLGFFGATAIAKPTGVAVTAAGIHAALVSLGLIAA